MKILVFLVLLTAALLGIDWLKRRNRMRDSRAGGEGGGVESLMVGSDAGASAGHGGDHGAGGDTGGGDAGGGH